MEILSSFTHPHVVPNLYDLLSSVEHEKIFLKTFIIITSIMNVSVVKCCFGPIGLHFMDTKTIFLFSKYVLQSYVWNNMKGLNDNRISIFGWTIPLNKWNTTSQTPETLSSWQSCFLSALIYQNKRWWQHFIEMCVMHSLPWFSFLCNYF